MTISEHNNCVDSQRLLISIQMKQAEMAELLSLYIANLQKVSSELAHCEDGNKQLEIKVIRSKIGLAIQSFTSKSEELLGNSGGTSLGRLKEYLSKCFESLVKEAYRLINFAGKGKIDRKLKVIKEFEQEMTDQWEFSQKVNAKPPHLHTLNGMFTLDNIDSKTPIKDLAKSYLHQEFLAIRMISFSMYERYTEHVHDKIYDRITLAQQQQQSLQTAIEEAQQTSKVLKAEQKRLERDTMELKKVTRLIAERYFYIENEGSSSPN